MFIRGLAFNLGANVVQDSIIVSEHGLGTDAQENQAGMGRFVEAERWAQPLLDFPYLVK
jgi:hypothetical protein